MAMHRHVTVLNSHDHERWEDPTDPNRTTYQHVWVSADKGKLKPIHRMLRRKLVKYRTYTRKTRVGGITVTLYYVVAPHWSFVETPRVVQV